MALLREDVGLDTGIIFWSPWSSTKVLAFDPHPWAVPEILTVAHVGSIPKAPSK